MTFHKLSERKRESQLDVKKCGRNNYEEITMKKCLRNHYTSKQEAAFVSCYLVCILKRFNKSLKKTVFDINTLEDYNLWVNSIISEVSYYLGDNVMLSNVSILNQFIYSLYSP